ncbi:MAG: roadblock/LC7 domain-containing protein [Polyangiaceae bacterium]|nr:roadblock/LC7 domain-containing protein [Polyangiaceae bacterium]
MTGQESTGLTWQESYAALERGIARLVGEASATAAMVVRGDGQLLTWAGGLTEPSALGALAAGSMAASEALLASVDDGGRPSLSLDGREQSFFLTEIDHGAFLLVIFDRRCSLGLVRLRARRLVQEARPWMAGLRVEAAVLVDLGDEEVDALFAERSPA